MNLEQYTALTDQRAELRFDDAAVIPVEQITVRPEYRIFCEENACGNYGKNYSCPPASGTVSEMKARMQRFSNALVLRSAYYVENALDKSEAAPLKKQHNLKVRALIKALKEEGCLDQYLLILGGPCTLCEKCAMPEGKPCLFESERASCLSAYCIDVNALAKASGMEISWSTDQISYFSLLLF